MNRCGSSSRRSFPSPRLDKERGNVRDERRTPETGSRDQGHPAQEDTGRTVRDRIYLEEFKSAGRSALNVGNFMVANRKLSLYVALFLTGISFGLEFHHHEDAVSHPDCSFCAVIHQTQSASVQHQESGKPFIAHSSLVLPSERPDPVSRHFAIPVIRPPPA